MKLKPDQERVKNLLSDTVALLCKNGLAFEKELKIQGLLGVTIDDNDVFIVHLNESYAGLLAAEEAETASVTSKDSVAPEQKSKDSRNEGGAPKRPHPSPMRSHSQSPHTESKRPRPSSSHLQSPHRRASHSSSNDSVVVQVKQEKEDDIELVEAKSEPNFGGYYGAHSEMGGPHGKRRTEMFPAGNAQEPYITSVMRNPGGGEPGSSWDPNSSQPSTLAHDSQLDATSGSSQWNPGLGLPPGSEGYMLFAHRQRRPTNSSAKEYRCTIDNCGKMFYQTYNLYRHQRIKHGGRIEYVKEGGVTSRTEDSPRKWNETRTDESPRKLMEAIGEGGQNSRTEDSPRKLKETIGGSSSSVPTTPTKSMFMHPGFGFRGAGFGFKGAQSVAEDLRVSNTGNDDGLTKVESGDEGSVGGSTSVESVARGSEPDNVEGRACMLSNAGEFVARVIHVEPEDEGSSGD